MDQRPHAQIQKPFTAVRLGKIGHYQAQIVRGLIHNVHLANHYLMENALAPPVQMVRLVLKDNYALATLALVNTAIFNHPELVTHKLLFVHIRVVLLAIGQTAPIRN